MTPVAPRRKKKFPTTLLCQSKARLHQKKKVVLEARRVPFVHTEQRGRGRGVGGCCQKVVASEPDGWMDGWESGHGRSEMLSRQFFEKIIIKKFKNSKSFLLLYKVTMFASTACLMVAYCQGHGGHADKGSSTGYRLHTWWTVSEEGARKKRGQRPHKPIAHR